MSDTRQDRIVTLDILRGIALFGMIVVHFHQRMEKPATGAEDIIGWVVWMGLESKAWATFALLFGAGFAILMRRLESRGLNVVPTFVRRMLALAFIGIVVQLLTGFRILLEYAMWGAVLLFIRKLATRMLVIIAIAAAVAGPVVSRVTTVDRQNYSAHWNALHHAEDSASFVETVKVRAAFAGWWYTRVQTVVPDSNLVLFIIGLLAIRLGVFENPRSHRRLILGMMTFGAASWVTQWFIVPKLPATFEWTGIISDQWLAFTYVGAMVLLLEEWPHWKQRLSMFAIAGRMALTNYVIQATVLSLLACGYGLALKIRPYYEVPASIALFSACVLFSAIWLARHAYGPLERLWRAVTYAEWVARGRPSSENYRRV